MVSEEQPATGKDTQDGLPPPRFRVLTWNLHGCVGRDRRRDPERCGRFLRAIKPEIAALQEVDTRHRLDGQVDPAEHLRAQVGSHAIEAHALREDRGSYGQILVSRWPLREGKVHDISQSGREPRKVIEAVCETPWGPLHVLATHLGLDPGERRRQAETLEGLLLREPEMPSILLGDFNDWRGGRGPLHGLMEPLLPAFTRERTFPTWLPVFPLDRIWCRPAGLFAGSEALRNAGRASDHLPLIAEIDCEALAAAAESRQGAA